MSEELDLKVAIEATAKALFASEEPDRNAWRWDRPNPADPARPFAWHDYWLNAATLALQAAMPHIREAIARQLKEQAHAIEVAQFKAMGGLLTPLPSGIVAGWTQASRFVRGE